MCVVEWVAARPEARGKGVAQRLLDLLLERGRSLGYEQAQISCLLGNTPAKRCYERTGFRVVDEKRHPDFEAIFGAPGTARMLRGLYGGPGRRLGRPHRRPLPPTDPPRTRRGPATR